MEKGKDFSQCSIICSLVVFWAVGNTTRRKLQRENVLTKSDL